jgi:hypothetical protein
MAETKIRNVKTNDIVKSMTKMRIVPSTGDIVKKKRVVSEEFRQQASARLKEFGLKVNKYLETHPDMPRKEAMKAVSIEEKKLKVSEKTKPTKTKNKKLKASSKITTTPKTPFDKPKKKITKKEESENESEEEEKERIVYPDNIDNVSDNEEEE